MIHNKYQFDYMQFNKYFKMRFLRTFCKTNALGIIATFVFYEINSNISTRKCGAI